MGYAIPRISKLKTVKQMSDSYNHNFRIFHVENADPLKSHLNEELVDQLNGRTYLDVANDEVRYLQMIGSQKRPPRVDAVRGFEVMLSFSREDAENIDVDKWAEASVAWLRETFNPPNNEIRFINPDTGKEDVRRVNNVKSVVMHMDESRPHIHAFIIPVDQRGHLNARYYTGDREKMVSMQDSYAQAMKPFGLKRGERHSVARHEDVSTYYTKLVDAVHASLPEPEKGESVQEYHARANDAYQTAMVHHRDKIVKMEQEIVKAKSAVYDDRASLNTEREQFLYEKAEYSREIERMADSLGESPTPEVMRRVRREASENERFKKAVDEHPDRNKAESAERLYHEMVEWQRSRERKDQEKERKHEQRRG